MDDGQICYYNVFVFNFLLDVGNLEVAKSLVGFWKELGKGGVDVINEVIDWKGDILIILHIAPFQSITLYEML